MNKAQRGTLSIAWIAILAVNLPYAIPRGKGPDHVLGADTVAVCVPYDSSLPTVPVYSIHDKLPKTGQYVMVSIRNDYRDDEIQFAPRLTFFLLLGFGIIFSIVTRITARSSTSTPP